VRSPEEYVGLDETEDGIWSVYFGPVLLGRFHELDYGEPAERVVTSGQRPRMDQRRRQREGGLNAGHFSSVSN
jgi:hypothetical protein